MEVSDAGCAVPIDVSGLRIGAGLPLVLLGGPCVIESEAQVLHLAARLGEIAAEAGVPFVFKASFDKANRTSAESRRGPGLTEGLRILRRVRDELGLRVTTDVHEPAQVPHVADVVDLLQVPAFLCRQTDLLLACGRSGRPVNVKKGPFLAPWDVAHVVAKLRSAGATGVLVTERGTTFGYNTLVVDMRAIPVMRALGVPVCFDATHTVQHPGGERARSGGDRAHAPPLARAAVAAGADAVFAEIHEDPDRAWSDAATQLPVEVVPPLLRDLVALRAITTGGAR